MRKPAAETRTGSTKIEASAEAPVRRRMITADGVAPEHLAPGDLVVLERDEISRTSLTRLADELAAKGAAGLIVRESVLSGLKKAERSAIEDRLPILTIGGEAGAGAGRLLEAEWERDVDPNTVLRAILRGDPVMGSLPPHMDAEAPMRALAFLAHGDDTAPLPLAKLEEIVAAEALLRDPRSHALSLDGVVVALMGDYDFTEEDGIADTLHHRAKSALLMGTLTVGVGRAHSGIPGIRRSYREALWAAQAAELLEAEGRVMSYRDLGIYAMLEPFVADPSAADTEDVEQLIEYDRQNHTALLPTLEAYFEAGASGDAAASLFVHRNTVSYRLRAVKRVTGLDVRDPDQRLLLEVQIRLARIRGLLPAKQSQPPRRSKRGRRS